MEAAAKFSMKAKTNNILQERKMKDTAAHMTCQKKQSSLYSNSNKNFGWNMSQKKLGIAKDQNKENEAGIIRRIYNFSKSKKKLDSSQPTDETKKTDMQNKNKTKCQSLCNSHESFEWNSEFFTSPGILNPKEMCKILKVREPKYKVNRSPSLECEKSNKAEKSDEWNSAFFTEEGLLTPEELSTLSNGNGLRLLTPEELSTLSNGNGLQDPPSLKKSDTSSPEKMKSKPTSMRKSCNSYGSENMKPTSLPVGAQSSLKEPMILSQVNSPLASLNERSPLGPKHVNMENKATKSLLRENMTVSKGDCPRDSTSDKSPSLGSYTSFQEKLTSLATSLLPRAQPVLTPPTILRQVNKATKSESERKMKDTAAHMTCQKKQSSLYSNSDKNFGWNKFSLGKKKFDVCHPTVTKNADMQKKHKTKCLSLCNSHESFEWNSEFFTSPGTLNPKEMCKILKFREPKHKVNHSPSLECEKSNKADKSDEWNSAFFTDEGLLTPEELSTLSNGNGLRLLTPEELSTLSNGNGLRDPPSLKKSSGYTSTNESASLMSADTPPASSINAWSLEASSPMNKYSIKTQDIPLVGEISIDSDASQASDSESETTNNVREYNIHKSFKWKLWNSAFLTDEALLILQEHSIVGEKKGSFDDLKASNVETSSSKIRSGLVLQNPNCEEMIVLKRPFTGEPTSSDKSPSLGSCSSTCGSPALSCAISDSAPKSSSTAPDSGSPSALRYTPRNNHETLDSASAMSFCETPTSSIYTWSSGSIGITPQGEICFGNIASQASDSLHHLRKPQCLRHNYNDRPSSLQKPSPKIGHFDHSHLYPSKRDDRRCTCIFSSDEEMIVLMRPFTGEATSSDKSPSLGSCSSTCGSPALSCAISDSAPKSSSTTPDSGSPSALRYTPRNNQETPDSASEMSFCETPTSSIYTWSSGSIDISTPQGEICFGNIASQASDSLHHLRKPQCLRHNYDDKPSSLQKPSPKIGYFDHSHLYPSKRDDRRCTCIFSSDGQ